MVNERLTREWIKENEDSLSWQLHKERYTFACTLLNDKTVLDIACGTGYGSEMLAKKNKVVGVDIDPTAINEAKNHTPNVSFICSSFENLTEDQKYNAIVSLETIEHLENPVAFIEFCYNTLLPDGKLIISAPISYTTDLNYFHLTDFTEHSFRNMIEAHGFNREDKHLHQKQKMLDKENTSKLSTKEYTALLWLYIKNPLRIWKRIIDFSRNGLNVKYLLVVYTKTKK